MASWNLVNIGLGCGLFPVCCQVNTWSSADLFPVGPLEINFSEIQIAIQTFLLKKMHLENVICKLLTIQFKSKYPSACEN